MVVAIGLLISVAISECEITLGEVRGSSNLVDAIGVALRAGQRVVSLLKIGYNLLKQLLVCKLCV